MGSFVTSLHIYTAKQQKLITPTPFWSICISLLVINLQIPGVLTPNTHQLCGEWLSWWCINNNCHISITCYRLPLSHTAVCYANRVHLKSDTAQTLLTALRVWAFATETNKLRNKHAHRKYWNSFLRSRLCIPVKGMFQHAAKFAQKNITSSVFYWTSGSSPFFICKQTETVNNYWQQEVLS